MNQSAASPACLYIVGTPLGNLEDITFRAVELLRRVPVIACEDTRHSARLLARYGIKARLISCHEHNEQAAAAQVASLLHSGLEVALISDAGTPGISDPGYRVVSLALEQGLQVVPVPGPSALTASLCAAGLPTDSFYFAGFVPARQKALENLLRELSTLKGSLVFYCPARRIKAVLPVIRGCLGQRRAAICRELTKIHEEFIRGTLTEIERGLETRETLKGEIVLIVEGRGKSTVESENAGADLAGRLGKFLDGVAEARARGARSLTVLAAEELGEKRNRIYPLVCAWLNRLR